MAPANGLTGREICKLIEKNSLMDAPIWNPDNNEVYGTLQFIIKDADEHNPSYEMMDINVLNGTATRMTGRIEN